MLITVLFKGLLLSLLSFLLLFLFGLLLGTFTLLIRLLLLLLNSYRLVCNLFLYLGVKLRLLLRHLTGWLLRLAQTL